jgi:hypothetical protein
MSSDLGADAYVPLGYTACRCGEWVVTPVDGSTLALCPECRAALKGRSDEGRLRYEIDGRAFTRKPPKPRKRHHAKRTPAQKETRRKLDRARIRAYVRLAEIYRPMYELLYAEEKLREGLEPSTASVRPRPRAIAAQLEADLDEAEERARRSRPDAV